MSRGVEGGASGGAAGEFVAGGIVDGAEGPRLNCRGAGVVSATGLVATGGYAGVCPNTQLAASQVLAKMGKIIFIC